MHRTAFSLFALGIMTIAAMPPAAATHGDTAYLIGIGFPFIAETYYVTGPGYLNQFWNFAVVSVNAQDSCQNVHGGWDPDPRPPPLGNPGPPGFSGSCFSGAAITTTGINHYHPYPNTASACAPVPACGGLDVHTISVTYDGNTFDAQLIVCDNGANTVLNRVTSTYCTDLRLLSAI